MKTLKAGSKKFLNDSELKSFQAVLQKSKNKRDLFAFNLILFLGLRVQEAINIRLKDINNLDQTIIIRGLKSGRIRTYEIPGKIWRKYKAWLKERKLLRTSKNNPYLFPSRFYNDSPITAQTFKKLFKIYAKKAGLGSNYSIHSLRHTCAMIRVLGGSHPIAVQKWLRHRSLSSTQIYFEAAEFEKDNETAAKQFEKYL